MKKKRILPPTFGGVEEGNVIWHRLDDIDFDELGFILSCHLIIEHYMDQFLMTGSDSKFGWDSAKLSFSQKMALISGLTFPDPYGFMPAVKHLNSVRNQFSHKLNKRLTEKDMLPIKYYLEQYVSYENKSWPVPTDFKDMLDLFTTITCSFFAGSIAARVKYEAGT
ncbi:hypothetical protein IDSA_05520 [Pseudidiomarina salinarum]|uniref:Uncharacterized protein n=2 Tax=Pseudidiomarina salinarum TaxID=435908 RepID=A0A094J235_9GAMM|nr:hypothetical protein IDSA_05520 [Pseudidiomarina salinarum]